MKKAPTDIMYVLCFFTDIFQFSFSDCLLKKDCVVKIFDMTSTSQIPDLLHLCQNDFNSTLNGIDKFVRDILAGGNSHQKLKMCEKMNLLNQVCQFSKKQTTKSIASKVDVTVNVPNELWLKIISYLKCKDIFLGFGQVSKRFNELIHDPTAIKSFEFKLNENSIYHDMAMDMAMEVLKYSKQLIRISLTFRYAPYDPWIEKALISSPNLKSVTLYEQWNNYLTGVRTLNAQVHLVIY